MHNGSMQLAQIILRVSCSHISKYFNYMLLSSQVEAYLTQAQRDVVVKSGTTCCAVSQYSPHQRTFTVGIRVVALQVELGADGVICANVGDSRALLLFKEEEEQQWRCQALSSDHNAQNVSESRRLENAGVQPGAGCDHNHNSQQLLWGCACPDKHGRIWNRDRSMGWNFTQSLGDVIGKQCGLCCDPEVKVASCAQLLTQLNSLPLRMESRW